MSDTPNSSGPDQPDNTPGPDPDRDGQRPPIHAPRVHRPAVHPAMAYESGDPPSGFDAPYLLDRYSVLTHELANLLDGSLRTLLLAQRSLDDSGDPQTNEADRLRRRLDTVQQSLARMTDLVRASAAGSDASIGSHSLGPRAPITIAEAAHHAADVLGPIADERGVEIALSIQPEASVLPAQTLYTVVLNALRNAIDAAGDALGPDTGGATGHVELRAERDRAELLLTVIDDGAGPHPEGTEHAFRHGYTTKASGNGIGLALCRQIVEHLGGEICLARREGRDELRRPGAVLSIRVPIQAMPTEPGEIS